MRRERMKDKEREMGMLNTLISEREDEICMNSVELPAFLVGMRFKGSR